MCIVIDANAAHELDGEHEAGKPVLRWLLAGPGKLVASQKILAEISANYFLDVVQALEQAGKLIKVNENLCEKEEHDLRCRDLCRSNDHHIISVVKVQRCELVFTHDKPLHDDLKNRDIIEFRVKIYQNEGHHRLLGQCRCG